MGKTQWYTSLKQITATYVNMMQVMEALTGRPTASTELARINVKTVLRQNSGMLVAANLVESRCHVTNLLVVAQYLIKW